MFSLSLSAVANWAKKFYIDGNITKSGFAKLTAAKLPNLTDTAGDF